MNNQNDIASFLRMNARRRSPLETMQYVSPQDPNQMPSYAPAMPQQAAPQGDGTGAGDMDPSFIRAVQREMQGEQAPQGLPPAQGQQMAQAPQDQGVQGDIAAGVRAASGFAYGGAVRGYQVGGEVREEDFERLRRLTGINDQKLLKQRMDELKGGGFFGTKKSVPELLSEMEAAKSAEFRRTNVSGLAGARPESVTGIDEVQPYSYPTPMGPASAPIVASQPVDPAAVVRLSAPKRAADAAAAQPPAPAPAPDAANEKDTSQKPVDDGGYAERMKKLLDDDEGDMTPREKSMALIQAGAAMMAGASKPGATFLGSAGEGLTKGLEGFNETRSNRAVKRMKQAAMLQAERQAGIENTRGNRALELQEQDNKLARDKYETEKDPNSPENKYRSAATKALTKLSNFAEINAESKRISALPPGPEKDAAIETFDRTRGTTNQQTLNSRQNAKLVEVSLKAGAAFDKSLDAVTGTPAEIKAKRNAAVMAAVQEAKGLLGLSDSGIESLEKVVDFSDLE